MGNTLTTSFAGYKTRYLRHDFMAALVVTALAIPESISFAVLIGLPVETGLYTALLAPLIYAIFASSKRLIVGADSTTAALIAGGVGIAGISGVDPISAVTAVTFLAGVLIVLFGLLRLGFLADLISRPVLVGFLGGVGLQLILGKLGDVLGIATEGNTIEKLSQLVVNFPLLNQTSLMLAIAVLLAIFIGNQLKLPGALLGLITALILSSTLQLGFGGVETIGSVTPGLPHLVLPSWSASLAIDVFPLAMTIAFVVLAQSSAVTRTMATKHEESLDDNRDLVALGFANISSAFIQGFSVNGSPPRSKAAELAGGRSQMVNVFMVVLILLLLLYGTRWLENIPLAALAAIIIAIGVHLIDIPALRHIYQSNKTEFLIAMVAMMGVALFGVRTGVFIAIITSLAERMRREYRPVDRVLIRDQEIDEWARNRIDPHHRFSSKPPGLVVYRFGGAIFFENANYFSERLLASVSEAKEAVHNVIVDAGSITDIDYTGAEAIVRCHRILRADDTQLTFAHVSPALHSLFKQYGLVKILGKDHIFPTLNEAIKAHPDAQRSVIDMVKRLALPRDSFVVIGGGVMEVLGIRQTYDVDLVVSKSMFSKLQKRGWDEDVQDDGKHVLIHNGYKVMTSWVGMDFTYLRKRAFAVDDVSFMNLRDVLKAKRKIGRKKDLRDIKLIRTYLQRSTE